MCCIKTQRQGVTKENSKSLGLFICLGVLNFAQSTAVLHEKMCPAQIIHPSFK